MVVALLMPDAAAHCPLAPYASADIMAPVAC